MQKTIHTIILLTCLLLFLGMTNIVKLIYPPPYLTQDVFNKAYYLDERLEEVLYCLLFLYIFLKSTGIRKGLAAFGFTVVYASLIDKVFLNQFHYESTDIIILVVGAVIGYFAHKRQ